MLSKKNQIELSHSLNKFKFDPIISGEVFNAEYYFNNLNLLPNQFAYIIDISNGTIPYYKGFDSFLGYNQENITIDFLFGLFHPDDADEMMQIVKEAYEFGFGLKNAFPFCVQFMVSYRIRKANGEYIKALRQSSLLEVDGKGKMISTISICSDISHLGIDKTIKFKMHGDQGDEFLPDFSKLSGQKKSFTKREIELVKLISEGLCTKEIAVELKLSAFTIETQRKNMLKKFQFKNTFQLVVWAKDQGII